MGHNIAPVNMKFVAITSLAALVGNASANVLAHAALGLVDNLDFVKRLPLSPTQRSRFNAEAEGHTTSVDLCAADDMDPCMDSTCEMWDTNKASLDDAVERLETCDWMEESTMSSTTVSVDFAECDAVYAYESTCGSTEGQFRKEDMLITCTSPVYPDHTIIFEFKGLPACFGHACDTEGEEGLEELEQIVTHEVMEDLEDYVEEETGEQEVAIHCEGVINPERFRGFVRQAVAQKFHK